MSLDSFLNVLIPIAAIIFFGSIIYKAAQEPIDKFIAWIKGLLKEEKSEVDPFYEPEIIYR